MRQSQEEAMGEEQSPPPSVETAGEVAVSGEDGSKEAQEGKMGRAAAEATAAASEKGQKLTAQYKGAAEANP